jgi:hypothetical protein
MRPAVCVRRSMVEWCGGVLVALGAIGLVSGCGGASGPERYELSGTVQFQGKPVPAGQIVFEPDSSKGNVGPQGMAEIREGKYDTRDGGRGMVGGPHVVRIRGYDRLSLDEMHPPQPLFPEYETTVDLSKEDGVYDFDVPAGAKK